MAQMFEAAPSNDLPDVPNYNVCPTDRVHAVLVEAGARRLQGLRWGFLPQWYDTPGDGPLLINARADTIADKPAFRQAVRQRRCLIPASGFYEWTKNEEGRRLPWFIHRSDGAPLVFAGIWQDWGADGLRTCAIVTTAAQGAMTQIHSRVPVVLDPADHALWLGEAGHGAARLMRAVEDGVLTAYRVDPKVNSNRAEGPELIEPV